MPYKNNWEAHGVYRKFTGKLTCAGILESVQKVEADPCFDTIRYVINDYLDVNEVDVSLKNIRVIAAIDSAATLSNPHIILAQVTTNPEIETVIAEYTRTLTRKSYPSKTFTHLKLAREWVDEELTQFDRFISNTYSERTPWECKDEDNRK